VLRAARPARCLRVALLVLPALIAVAKTGAAQPAELEVFTRQGCARCAEAERFLGLLQDERPELRLRIREVDTDPSALRRLSELAAQNGLDVVGVPAFHARGELIIGFVSPEATGARIRALVAGTAGAAAAGETCAADPTAPCAGAEEIEEITLPFLGPLAAGDLGLPLFTVAVGLLDGFNPCAMWVLLFLLSLLVNVHDRRRMLLIAGGFVVVSGVVYFAFMAAWLNVFLLVGFSATARVVVGAIAAIVGAVNIKDFFAWGAGFSLSIPAPAKPTIYAHARRILQADNLAAALAAIIVLALLVNTVELLCTAGLPAVYTHILTQHRLPWWSYYGYLALYNAAYILDDSLMVVGAVVTMQRFKLQEHGGRWLKLVSGLVLLLLGLVLLLKPGWLAFELR
jgi:hypothetical protein